MTALESIVTQTENWAKRAAKQDISPFARHHVDRESIRYTVVQHTNTDDVLNELVSECEYLMNHKVAEATLLILSNTFQSVEEFDELVGLTKKMLVKQGFAQVYKLAIFHPNHRLAGETQGKPENDTNRSPYPCLYIIKESRMEYRFENQEDLMDLDNLEEPDRKQGWWEKPVKYANLILAIGTTLLAFASGELGRLMMVPMYLAIYISIK